MCTPGIKGDPMVHKIRFKRYQGETSKVVEI